MSIDSEGTYPIGRSGNWHGGIHKLSRSPEGWVEPYFNGKAIACKIQKEYLKIHLNTTITVDEYNTWISDEEKKAYTKAERNLYKTESPPEREFSTSYVLLEHRITIPKAKTKADNKEIDLTFNIFTFYMHLLPYGIWEAKQRNFGRLPFYLKWSKFKITNVNKNVSYLTVGDNKIYNGTKCIIVNEKIFYPSENLVKNGCIPIETVIGKSDKIIIQIDVSSSYIDKYLKMKLKPIQDKVIALYNTNVSASVYPYYPQELYLLGYINLKQFKGYFRVDFQKEEREPDRWFKVKNYIIIKFKNIDNSIIENCSKGIIINSAIEKQSHDRCWLYEENPVSKITFKAVLLETYNQKDKQSLINKGFVVTLEGKEYVIISPSGNLRPQNYSNYDDLYIFFNNKVVDNTTLKIKLSSLNVAPYSIFHSNKGENLYFYQLKKKTFILDKYDIKQISSSPNVVGFTVVQLCFDEKKEYTVVASANDFELVKDDRPTSILKITLGEGLQEEGIPCSDDVGYIRELLHKDDTFTHMDSWRDKGEIKIDITEIKNYNRTIKRRLTYVEGEAEFQRNVIINDTYCQKISQNGENDICVLKQDYKDEIKVYSTDYIGKIGKFDNIEKCYHVETFFTNDTLIRDLFEEKYIFNKYHVTSDLQLYEKKVEKGLELYFPALMEWSVIKTCGNYSFIKLEKLALYFNNADVKKQDNGKYRIEKTIKQIYVQNEVVSLSGTSVSPKFEKFKDLIKSVLLLNLEFEEEPKYAIPKNKYTGLYFDTNADLTIFTCWIKTELLHNNDFSEKDMLYIVGGHERKTCNTYTVYDSYPELFEKISDKVEASFYKFEEEQGYNGAKYVRFTSKGKTYYCKRTDLKGGNVLNWKDHFYMIDNSKHVDGIYCDDINDALGLEVTDKKRGPVQISSYNLLKLQNRVCKFPMEWNKDLHKLCRKNADCEKCGENCSQKRVYDIFSKADVWHEIKDKIEAHEDNIWHVHPDYFWNYAKNNLIHEFNPYFGKHMTIEDIEFDCKNNPGFAPIYDPRRGSNNVNKDEFKDSYGNSYAMVTAHFNRIMYNDKHHEGIDFRGSVGVEIRSFIFGHVINAGWTRGGYGQVLIVANERDEGIYMLAHLSGFAKGIQRGSKIEPHDVVAYVGQSGNGEKDYWVPERIPGAGPHLHVSYYKVQYKASDDSNDDLNKYVIKVNDKLEFQSNLQNSNIRSPFKHDEPKQQP